MRFRKRMRRSVRRPVRRRRSMVGRRRRSTSALRIGYRM